jgi:hypothetical protein
VSTYELSLIKRNLINQLSGGGNDINKDLDKFSPALRWMTYEAIDKGLKMKPFNKKWVDATKTEESLSGIWNALEYYPFRRLSYEDRERTIKRYEH